MSADVDIDFADRKQILNKVKHVPARQENSGEVRRHNSGVFVTDIPVDPVNGCSGIDYREAEQRGYFKIDFLNQSVYDLIQDQTHYDRMLAKKPSWDLLLDKTFCERVVHIGNYSDLVAKMRPDSIERMAAFIAIIRPGKAHLQGQTWETVFDSVWDGDDSRGFVFKKSHSISYAR
jgi:DNA polymerase III, alpha subunit